MFETQSSLLAGRLLVTNERNLAIISLVFNLTLKHKGSSQCIENPIALWNACVLGMVQTKLIFWEFVYQLFVLKTPIKLHPHIFGFLPNKKLPEADNSHEGDAQYDVSNVAEYMSIVSYASIWILAEVVVVTCIQVARGQGGFL